MSLLCPNDLTAWDDRVRQNAEEIRQLVAGDSGHGGASQGQEWVRNRLADPVAPLTPTATA